MGRLRPEDMTARHRLGWTAWEQMAKAPPEVREEIVEKGWEDFAVPAPATLASYLLMRRLGFSAEEAADLYVHLAGRPVCRLRAFYDAVKDEKDRTRLRSLVVAFGRKYAARS